MFIYVVILSYILGNVFIVFRILSWLKVIHKPLNHVLIKEIVVSVYVVIATIPIIAFLWPKGQVKRILQLLSNDFMGAYIYMLLMAFIFCIIYLIFKLCLKKEESFFKLKRYLYTTCLITLSVIAFTCVYGIIHAKKIYVNDFNVQINKASKEKDLKVALVADLHLGYNVGYETVEQMTTKINKENPDIIIIAGDIYDNDYESLDNPNKIKKSFSKLKSKYGTYAVFGNHDVSEQLFAGFSINAKKKHKRDDRMEELLLDSNIKILDDETKLINNSFYLIGRKDYKEPGKGNRKSIEKLTSNLDKSLPLILIDHEPVELKENANNGIDLELSGHTHNGQMFPLNLANCIVFENGYGKKQVNQMTSLVTSGIGVYGPNMRVGTDSEIAIVNIKFNK